LVGGGRSSSEDATELEKAWCPVIHDDFRLDRPAFETYARLNEPREQAPFLWNTTPNGYWMITRYDDNKEALQRPDVFSNRITSAIGKREQCLYLIPQNLDSQAHVDCRHDATEMFLGIIGLPVEDGAYPLPRVETSWPASSAVIRSPRPERPMSQAVLRAGHRSAPRGTGRRQDGLRLVSAPGEDGRRADLPGERAHAVHEDHAGWARHEAQRPRVHAAAPRDSRRRLALPDRAAWAPTWPGSSSSRR
jgi:hypothetical protein